MLCEEEAQSTSQRIEPQLIVTEDCRSTSQVVSNRRAFSATGIANIWEVCQHVRGGAGVVD